MQALTSYSELVGHSLSGLYRFNIITAIRINRGGNAELSSLSMIKVGSLPPLKFDCKMTYELVDMHKIKSG